MSEIVPEVYETCSLCEGDGCIQDSMSTSYSEDHGCCMSDMVQCPKCCGMRTVLKD